MSDASTTSDTSPTSDTLTTSDTSTTSVRQPGPDAIFADPLLAACYDTFDGERDDLDHYREILAELGARTVIDVGCGTGSLATRLAAEGLALTGVDPALASLEVARAKPGGEAVDWIHGTAEDLPPLAADAAVMTGNVAQVFLTDDAWSATLDGIRAALRDGGTLVFESRRPERRAWEEWQAATDEVVHEVPGVGRVAVRPTGFEVALPLVTFSDEFRLEDGTTLTSTSTLRWRDEAELRSTLHSAGFEVEEIRDAPDRPGREHVVLARAV
ncbi:class I SAM-dependent methyltransferase [Brachybacterium sp. AOP43-C2-M15]|uniref:class I SAM-dependent methyltransferase n=1 Tax=Brachybacterium sp. AOP43-C2-M15 TaxID=3457661 RepID=UPI0040337403